MSRRTWVLTAAALVPVVAVGCASMGQMKPEEAIAARQQLMKDQGAAWKNIQDKTKAGDVAGLLPDAQKLVDTSKQIPELFPEGSLNPEKSAAKPQDAKATVKVDMSRVSTGIEKRDADMRGKNYLDTEVEGNKWVTFEVRKVEVTGPLQPGKEAPAKVHGVLTIKQKPTDTVADATVMYIKLSPEQVEQQKRFGFTSDNVKVKAKLNPTFTAHGIQVPQLLFLKVANDIQMLADLVFVRQ